MRSIPPLGKTLWQRSLILSFVDLICVCVSLGSTDLVWSKPCCHVSTQPQGSCPCTMLLGCLTFSTGPTVLPSPCVVHSPQVYRTSERPPFPPSPPSALFLFFFLISGKKNPKSMQGRKVFSLFLSGQSVRYNFHHGHETLFPLK